jgi:hypothetical protein
MVKVFAVNYNVLRIMSGMGGLAYSNWEDKPPIPYKYSPYYKKTDTKKTNYFSKLFFINKKNYFHYLLILKFDLFLKI